MKDYEHLNVLETKYRTSGLSVVEGWSLSKTRYDLRLGLPTGWPNSPDRSSPARRKWYGVWRRYAPSTESL